MRIISLFTGFCGLDLGVRLAMPSARVVLAVEGEATALALLEAKMRAGLVDSCPGIERGVVRIGIEAPREVPVYREEVQRAIEREKANEGYPAI